MKLPSSKISLAEIRSVLSQNKLTKHLENVSEEQSRFLYAHLRHEHLLAMYFPKMTDNDRIRKSANTVGWNLPKLHQENKTQ